MNNLAGTVKLVYDKALASGELLFTESQVVLLPEQSIEVRFNDYLSDLTIQFQVRYAPSLAKKPTKTSIAQADTNPANPFLPYNPALHVADLEEHVLLLNKFCVVPHHTLIVTKEFKKQTSPLYPADLIAAFNTLKVLSDYSVAFYNCGDESGASQKHKHIQVIPSEHPCPLDAVLQNQDVKVGKLAELDVFPFANFWTKLPSAPTEDILGEAFFTLLDTMIDCIRRGTPHEGPTSGPSVPSYNVIMTKSWLMLVPRTKEHAIIDDEQISINSLGFAGMILVKTQQQLNTVRKAGMLALLKSVGYEKVPIKSTDEQEEALYGL